MKPVYQTIFEPPHGNCLQACVASVLELPPERVPNFMEAEGDEWQEQYEAFLQGLGLYPIHIPIEGNVWTPKGWHLMSGPSPRGPYHHEVVGFGGSLSHDPYPGGQGLVRAEHYTVFVVCNPERMALPKGVRNE